VTRLLGLSWVGAGAAILSICVKKPKAAPIGLPLGFFSVLYGVAENSRVDGPLSPLYEGYLSCMRSGARSLAPYFPHAKSVLFGVLGDFNGVVSMLSAPSIDLPWVNPARLSEAQRKMSPTLLLHGKFGDPAAFGDLAHAMHGRPLFTVRLPDPGAVTEVDLQIVEEKLAEIAALYGSGVPPCHLVGYSRGAEVAWGYAFKVSDSQIEQSPEIGRVVLLGTPYSGQVDPSLAFPNSVLEIDAGYEVLVDARSVLPEGQRIVVERCGHSGLVTHPTVLGQIAIWCGLS